MSKFLSCLCSKFEIHIDNEGLNDVLAAMTPADERKLLRQLREEATVLVLMVRLENEKRKDERKVKMEERKQAEIETQRKEIPDGLWN